MATRTSVLFERGRVCSVLVRALQSYRRWFQRCDWGLEHLCTHVSGELYKVLYFGWTRELFWIHIHLAISLFVTSPATQTGHHFHFRWKTVSNAKSCPSCILTRNLKCYENYFSLNFLRWKNITMVTRYMKLTTISCVCDNLNKIFTKL